LRPGEKLHEELFRPAEPVIPTRNPYQGGRKAKHPSFLALVAVLGRCGGNSTDLTQGYDRNGHIPTPVYFAAQAP